MRRPVITFRVNVMGLERLIVSDLRCRQRLVHKTNRRSFPWTAFFHYSRRSIKFQERDKQLTHS